MNREWRQRWLNAPYRPSRRQALKLVAAGVAGIVGKEAWGMNKDSGSGLERSTPLAVGVDPQGILQFLDAVEEKVGGLHSFMLLRHGKVAAEGWWKPYGPRYPHMLFSLSKSFTSTGVGLAVSEGRLTVEDRVLRFFPEDAPANPDRNLQAMRRTPSTGRFAPQTRTGFGHSSRFPSNTSRARTLSTTRARPTCCRPSSRRSRE